MATRPPKQERSKATVERVVLAAEQLMRDRGTDEFTLAEVCTLGRVSMGAIYYRFASKDDLLRLVHARLMEELGREMSAAVGRSVDRANDLPQLVRALIEALAEMLRHFAPLLRPLMLRSVSDPVIRAAGKETYTRMGKEFSGAILSRRAEIEFSRPDEAAEASYAIAYAALGRSLGLNVSLGHVADIRNWHALKRSLAIMCVSYLLAPADLVKRVAGPAPRSAASRSAVAAPPPRRR